MSVKKPTAEFLANQPYLYRAFSGGQAVIEVYDMRLDGWPADAHLVVDGNAHNAPGIWWYETREDQTDSETGERFTVLQFHDSVGRYPPQDHMGTHNIKLVVNGEVARSIFLTIIPWEDPKVQVVSEEEINGDLVKITFELTWPSTVKKVFSMLPHSQDSQPSIFTNGPWHGWVPGKFELKHDQNTGKTLVSGWTYRFIGYSKLCLGVGAESISGVTDTGNFYGGSIDRTIVLLDADRGRYAQINPSTRAGFNCGAGFAWEGNQMVTVGGSARGLRPKRGIFKRSTANDRFGNTTFHQILERNTNSSTLRPGYSDWGPFDVTCDVWKTDISGSDPSRVLRKQLNPAMFHPGVGIHGGVINADGGTVLIPDVSIKIQKAGPDGVYAPHLWPVTEYLPWADNRDGEILKFEQLGDVQVRCGVSTEFVSLNREFMELNRTEVTADDGSPIDTTFISSVESVSRRDPGSTTLHDGTRLDGVVNKNIYITSSFPRILDANSSVKLIEDSIMALMQAHPNTNYQSLPGKSDVVWPRLVHYAMNAVKECVAEGVWLPRVNMDYVIGNYSVPVAEVALRRDAIIEKHVGTRSTRGLLHLELGPEYKLASGLSIMPSECTCQECLHGNPESSQDLHDSILERDFGLWASIDTVEGVLAIVFGPSSWSFRGGSWLMQSGADVLTNGGF